MYPREPGETAWLFYLECGPLDAALVTQHLIEKHLIEISSVATVDQGISASDPCFGTDG